MKIDPATIPTPDALHVIDGLTMTGKVNTADAEVLANIASSIRRGHPQCQAFPVRPDRVCLVGSGPSLEDTLDELRALVWDGAHLVTVNGSYQWCIDHGLKPKAQVMLDARASNARFLDPDVPGCQYVLASQCHPDVWDRVTGRPNVWIFHALNAAEGPIKDLLDAYYLGAWQAVSGGTTVITRALILFRLMGYLRFDLFGADSCWMGETHHAFPQIENEADARMTATVAVSDRPDISRTFTVSPWMLKQLEDFAQLLRLNGSNFLMQVHGDGLLAFAIRACAEAASTDLLIETHPLTHKES